MLMLTLSEKKIIAEKRAFQRRGDLASHHLMWQKKNPDPPGGIIQKPVDDKIVFILLTALVSLCILLFCLIDFTEPCL